MNEIKSVPFVDSSLTGRGEWRGEGKSCERTNEQGEKGTKRVGNERGPLQIPIDMMHTYPYSPTALLPSSAIKTSN